MFEDPPPIKDETEAFLMTLAEGVVTFEMKEHYSSEDTARIPVEEYLRAWELDVALQQNRISLRFVFDRSKVIDRNPPPPGTPVTVDLNAAVIATSAMSAEVMVTRGEYPAPPKNFKADMDTRVMWEQYERYIQDRDRLLPMAYSCLTRLQFRAKFYPAKGDWRRKAASMYSIDYEVLDKLGELTTNLGDEVGARKLSPQSELRPPNSQEVTWIEAVLKRIIRRTGQYAVHPQRAWPHITMSDLPTL